MLIKKLSKYRQLFIYGSALAALLFLLKWLEFRFIIVDHAFEIYITLIALLFTGLGTWLALKLVKPKTETKIETIIIEKEVFKTAPIANGEFILNAREKEKLGLSNRELEVLQLMAEGWSNQEIANKLFLSLNTVKTHSSRLFEKLEVRRRIQAVEKAKRLQLIA